MTMDPVTLEILSNKASAIAEEMGVTLQRAGRTIYVKETADFSTALVSLRGEFFGYPQRTGVIGFVGLDCGPTIESFAGFEPGDVVLTNDPYGSKGLSTHLPDLSLIKPYFAKGKLICFGWCFIHSADIGGKVPSSISPSNTDIYQEGLRIPPVKLLRRGQVNEDVLSIYRANCRTPDLNWGDIQAMLASLDAGEKRVAELVEEYGAEAMIAAQEEILAYSERVARQALRKIPDGSYNFSDFMDDDLIDGAPVRVAATLHVEDGRVEISFSGSDMETTGPLNVPTGGRSHPWLVLRLVGFAQTYAPDLHLNAGVVRNIRVSVPEGTLLNPRMPAPVGVRSATGLRVFDVINGALAQAVPDLVTAAPAGTAVPVVLAEPSDGKGGGLKVTVVQFMVGGTGARAGADGMDGRDPGLSSMANNPTEIVESETSLTVLHYGLRPDSGGPGMFRGGCGQRYVFRVEREGCVVLARGIERARFQPWALAGGGAGAGFEMSRIGLDGRRERLGKIDTLPLAKGECIEVLSPGGGGFGNPRERHPVAVCRDVRHGYITQAQAREIYGVIVGNGGELFEPETAKLRAETRVWPVTMAQGAMRHAWERLFPARIAARLTARLIDLSPQLRTLERRAFFRRIDPRILAREELDLAAILDGIDPDAVDRSLEELEARLS